MNAFIQTRFNGQSRLIRADTIVHVRQSNRFEEYDKRVIETDTHKYFADETINEIHEELEWIRRETRILQNI